MKVLTLVSSLVLIGISTFVFFSSLSLGIGKLQNPGPGFMPFLASILVFTLSVFVFVKGIQGEKGGPSPLNRKRLPKPTLLVMAILAYSFLLDSLGFLISIFLLLFAMFSMEEPQKWRKNIVLSAIVVMISLLIFKKWLGVRFPAGIFSI